MPKALSLDLRHRFQRCLEDGLSGREAARRLLISAATASRLGASRLGASRLGASRLGASRLGRRIARGAPLDPAPAGPCRPLPAPAGPCRPLPAPAGPRRGKGKLAPHHGFLIELVSQGPDITLFELRDALETAHGLRMHHSAIGYALDRLGYSFEKRALLPMNAVKPASGRQEPIG